MLPHGVASLPLLRPLEAVFASPFKHVENLDVKSCNVAPQEPEMMQKQTGAVGPENQKVARSQRSVQESEQSGREALP